MMGISPDILTLEYPAESQMRRISIGRRNWLFTGSETGRQNLAILFSFAATCKANAVNYRQWLEDVLNRINTTPASQIDFFLPQNWASQPISEISRKSRANAPLSNFKWNPASLLSRRKICPGTFKGKKSQPKILLA